MGILLQEVTLFRQEKGLWDVLIVNDEITAIAPNLPESDHLVIPGQAKLLVPGFVDLHTHLREPGFTAKETIASGTLAAAKGGYVRVCAMPNTLPPPDTPEQVRALRQLITAQAHIPVEIIGAATKQRAGINASNAADLGLAGVVALSDDGSGIQNQQVLETVLQQCRQADLPYFSHCEDAQLSQDGIFANTIPAESEFLPLSRELNLVQKTGARYHLCHVSTHQGVALIQEAKEQGLPVSAEVTPHHLVLNAEEITEWTGLYKVNPPIRSPQDQAALIAGLKDGVIDCIATDHAPHTQAEKDQPPAEAPFGFSGIELAFPLLYTELVLTGKIALAPILTALILKPRQLIRLPQPSLGLQVGEPANLTLIDLATAQTVNSANMVSQGKNTPFLGKKLYGWPILTVVTGKIVWHKEGVFHAEL